MATRATYSFHSSRKPEITLYIHHDGYEAGAGNYIARAFSEGGDKSYWDYFTVESFIRANDRAEITRSHECHGDTEYRYDFFPTVHPGHSDSGIITLDSAVVVSKRLGWSEVTWSQTEFTVREFLLGFGQVPTVQASEPEGYAA